MKAFIVKNPSSRVARASEVKPVFKPLWNRCCRLVLCQLTWDEPLRKSPRTESEMLRKSQKFRGWSSEVQLQDDLVTHWSMKLPGGHWITLQHQVLLTKNTFLSDFHSKLRKMSLNKPLQLHACFGSYSFLQQVCLIGNGLCSGKPSVHQKTHLN